MDRPGVWEVPEGSGEQRRVQETGCEVICGDSVTPAVKGLMKVKVKTDSPEPSVEKVTVAKLPRISLRSFMD